MRAYELANFHSVWVFSNLAFEFERSTVWRSPEVAPRTRGLERDRVEYSSEKTRLLTNEHLGHLAVWFVHGLKSHAPV
jgi:hypothetical protein